MLKKVQRLSHLGQETRDYHKFESVFVPIGMKHKVANKTDKNVVIIEIGIGEVVSERDIVKIYTDESSEGNYIATQDNPVIKLDPAFKDNLWGWHEASYCIRQENAIMILLRKAGNYRHIRMVKAV